MPKRAWLAVLLVAITGCATEAASTGAADRAASSKEAPASPATAVGPTTEVAVPEAGASATELGLQGRIDEAHAAGGGTVRLTGAGPLTIDAPLRLYSDTVLAGDAASGEFGTVLVGASDHPGGWRENAMILVQGEAGAPVVRAAISDLDLRGTLLGSPIIVQNAGTSADDGVAIRHVRIRGAHRMAIAVTESIGTTITGVDIRIDMQTAEMQRGGGAALWLRQAQYSHVMKNTITMPDYFADGDPGNDGTRVMDCIATHGGLENTIAENELSYGNTAGIYVADCHTAGECNPVGGRERNPWIWGNTIHHFQQHGIDVANADRPTIKSNCVDTVGYSPLSLADSHDGIVQWNTLSNANGLGHLYAGDHLRSGAILLQWGSSRNGIYNNDLSGDTNAFAVTIWKGGSDDNEHVFPDCAGNAIGGANGNGNNNHWRHGSERSTHDGLWFDGSQDTLSNGIGENDVF